MTADISFSITVPIGSYHPLLADCLASLAAQNVPLEVAVMDASNDERVREVLDLYANTVTIRYHGPDEGQADAIASGWDRTSGNVLGWLNADDVLAPDALSHALSTFSNAPDTDVVYGHSLICDDDGYINGYHWNVMPPGEQILSTCCISQPSCFFRRSAVHSIGGLDRTLHYTMDWDLWIRLFKSGAKFRFNEDIWSLVLWSEDAKTGGFDRQRRHELKRILDQNESLRDRLNGYLGFASHYFYEYVLPRSLRNWVWRRNVSGGPGMFGLSVAGDVESQAVFRMFHYAKEPVTRIELKTSEKESDFELQFGGSLLSPTKLDDEHFLFELPKGLPAGKMQDLIVRCKSDSPIHIDGVRVVV